VNLSSPAGIIKEAVVRIPSEPDTLVGVVTSPSVASNGRAVVLCPGGWFGTATNRNRIFVRMARHLSAEGFTVLRFDWHGVGESTGQIDRYLLDEPFEGDVVAAVACLTKQGFDDVTLVGVCFGARSAFAAGGLQAVRRLVLLSFPVPNSPGMASGHVEASRQAPLALLKLAVSRSVLEGLRDHNARRVYATALRRKLRASVGRHLRWGKRPLTKSRRMTLTPPQLLRELTALADRGVIVDFLFGQDDLELIAFESFVDAPIRQLLDGRAALVGVRTLPGQIHGFGSLALQERVIEQIAELLTRGTQ
jgi:pimeloyl-ACP methyl ester carboxylesterase